MNTYFAPNSQSPDSASTQLPKRGILKNRSESIELSHSNHSSVSGEGDHSRKQHWDEMNILATFHPADKDYGFMKIAEADTPYERYTKPDEEEDESSEMPKHDDSLPKYVKTKDENYFFEICKNNMNGEKQNHSINFDELKNKLDSCNDDEEPKRRVELQDDEEDEEPVVSNKEFEKHRKAHYNEFQMAQLLRKQLEEEDEMEEKNEQYNDKNME